MAAELVDINQSSTTCDATGGIVYSWLVESKYVTAITVVADVVTNFTMSTPGKWAKFEYDRDATSNYAQTNNRNGKRRTYQQVAFMKFSALDSAIVIAANNAIKTCDVIAVHVCVSGLRLVQGLEVDAAATGGFVLTKVQQTLLAASQFTDTSNNEARTEFTLQGESNMLSPVTSLSDTAIAAL